ERLAGGTVRGERQRGRGPGRLLPRAVADARAPRTPRARACGSARAAPSTDGADRAGIAGRGALLRVRSVAGGAGDLRSLRLRVAGRLTHGLDRAPTLARARGDHRRRVAAARVRARAA